MIFITDILIHFVIRKHFSNQRWWLFKFSKGYPLELSPFWAKNEILNIQNLTSNNKMYQNSRLKSPKTSTCLFVKKCHNSCLELGNIKLMTLYFFLPNLFLEQLAHVMDHVLKWPIILHHKTGEFSNSYYLNFCHFHFC